MRVHARAYVRVCVCVPEENLNAIPQYCPPWFCRLGLHCLSGIDQLGSQPKASTVYCLCLSRPGFTLNTYHPIPCFHCEFQGANFITNVYKANTLEPDLFPKLIKRASLFHYIIRWEMERNFHCKCSLKIKGTVESMKLDKSWWEDVHPKQFKGLVAEVCIGFCTSVQIL